MKFTARSPVGQRVVLPKFSTDPASPSGSSGGAAAYPRIFRVRQKFARPLVTDIQATVHAEFARLNLAARVQLLDVLFEQTRIGGVQLEQAQPVRRPQHLHGDAGGSGVVAEAVPPPGLILTIALLMTMADGVM